MIVGMGTAYIIVGKSYDCRVGACVYHCGLWPVSLRGWGSCESGI